MPSIKKKLLASFFAIISVLLIVEGFFISMDYIILSKYMTLTDNMVSEYSLISDTSSLISSFEKRIKDPVDAAETANFKLIHDNIRALLARLDDRIVSAKSKIVFTNLENNISDILFELEIGTSHLSSGNYLEAIARYDSAKAKSVFVKENTSALILEELEYARDLQGEINEVRFLSQLIGLILLLITAVGCVWYAISFSDKLVSPLLKLTKVAKVIEAGDLRAKVDDASLMQGDDEVAILASSFEMMLSSLRASIRKLEVYNSEVKRSRNKLRAEKNKLQKYLDTAGVIVLIFDADNRVSTINKKGEEILGVKGEQVLGQDWVSGFVAKEYRTKTKNVLDFLIGQVASSDTLENVIVALDQSQKNIIWHFSLLKDENGSFQSVLATGVDVTELTKAKVTISQLKEVDKLKNEVLNIATHELKTPLISIVGLSEVMEKKPDGLPSEYQKYISIIHAEGLKLSNLIKTMLTANRNEIGKVSAVKEKFDLIELIGSLQTSLGMLAERSESKINFELAVEKLPIESDREKISQVIYNFVDNAVKYGPKGQTIALKLGLPDKRTVRVEVTGAGQGIPKEKQKKLFMKFSQLEPSLSRSQDGMGLGLYICKQNIDNLGGKIGVISEIGQGATFYFTLPL